MMLRRAALLSLTLALGGPAACGGTVTAGGAAEEDTSNVPSTPGCPLKGECATANCNPLSGGGDCSWSCTGLGIQCPEVVFLSQDGGGLVVDNPEAAACLFDALADGERGSYAWVVDPGEPFSTSFTLFVRPSRVALMNKIDQADAITLTAKRGPAKLQDADYFQSCKSLDGEGMLDCLDDHAGVCGVP